MISVIIPVYNSSQTLSDCLDGVFSNKFENFEVIIVDDKSTDNSIEIAKNYECKIIELNENKGPAVAKNTGANSASGDILLFVDSDVILKDNALVNVDRLYKNDDKNVLQGIYSHEPDYNNITTQYQQSFYCYYTWKNKEKYTETLTSMCFAIKKFFFIESGGFNENIKKATAEDEEFGYNLINKNYKLLICRELSVEHKVNYNLQTFIKRAFKINIDTMRSFLRNKTYIKKVKQKNYTNVLIGIALLGLITLSFLANILYANNINFYIFCILNLIFLSLHLGFFKFIKDSKGLLKTCKIIPICYIDGLIMLLASVYGAITYIFGKKY